MESIQKDNETISLKKIIIDYVRQWKLFLVAACLSLIPAILYLTFYPKTYEIMSRVKLQDDKDLGSGGGFGLGEAAGMMKSFGLSGATGSTVNIDDETAILSSNWLLKEVVLKLGLNVTYEKPFSFMQLYEHSPLWITLDSITQQNLQSSISFNVKVDDKGLVRVKMKNSNDKFSFQSLPAQLELPEGIVNIAYNKLSKEKGGFSLDINISPAGWVAEDLADAIEIEEFSKNSNVLELTFTDYEKTRGVELLNTLMDTYNKSSDLIKKEDGRKVYSFLDSRIQNVMSQLNEVEIAIEAYKLKNKMTDVEYDIKFYVDAIKSYREKIIEIEAQSHVLNLLDSYVNDPKNKYNLIPSILSVGEGEKGGAVSMYNEALIERERLKKSSKSDSPLSEIADSQLEKLRESVILAIDNARTSSRYVLDDLKSQEKVILDKMGQVPSYEREYMDLKRQQEIFQGVYLILLQKREEIALSLGQEKDRGFIVDSAFVKYRPIGPRKLYAAIFMILFTLMVPVGYLFCKKQLHSLIEEYKNTRSN